MRTFLKLIGLIAGAMWIFGGRYDIAQADPTAETVDKLSGPKTSGVTYMASGWVRYALTQVAVNGFLVAAQNPYGEARLVTKVVLRVSTAAESSAIADIDITTGATVTGDDIFDGVAISAAAVKDAHNATDNGTNGEDTSWLWDKAGGTNDYINAKALTDGATAIVGSLMIESIPAA